MNFGLVPLSYLKSLKIGDNIGYYTVSEKRNGVLCEYEPMEGGEWFGEEHDPIIRDFDSGLRELIRLRVKHSRQFPNLFLKASKPTGVAGLILPQPDGSTIILGFVVGRIDKAKYDKLQEMVAAMERAFEKVDSNP